VAGFSISVPVLEYPRPRHRYFDLAERGASSRELIGPGALTHVRKRIAHPTKSFQEVTGPVGDYARLSLGAGLDAHFVGAPLYAGIPAWSMINVEENRVVFLSCSQQQKPTVVG
jgi:hypothetical protein